MTTIIDEQLRRKESHSVIDEVNDTGIVLEDGRELSFVELSQVLFELSSLLNTGDIKLKTRSTQTHDINYLDVCSVIVEEFC